MLEIDIEMRNIIDEINHSLKTKFHIFVKCTKIQLIIDIFYKDKILKRERIINNKESLLKFKVQIYEFLSPEEVLEKFKSSNLPSLIVRYVDYCIHKEEFNTFISSFMTDFKKSYENLLKLLKRSSKILKISVAEIIKLTDLKYKQVKDNRIRNALAELRSVVCLDNLGFQEIKLLQAVDNHQQADLIAISNNKKYVFDVKNIITTQFQKNKFYSVDDIIKRCKSVLKQKRNQIKSTIDIYKADFGGVILVIDEINGLYALNSEEELKEMFIKKMHVLEFEYNKLIFLFNSSCISFL